MARAVKEQPKRAGRSQGAVSIDGLLVGEDHAQGKAKGPERQREAAALVSPPG